MAQFNINLQSKTILADTLTPVNVYLKIRDKFSHPLLLESTDFKANENSLSIVCFESIAHIELSENTIKSLLPDGQKHEQKIETTDNFVPNYLHSFFNKFSIQNPDKNLSFSGFYGYNSYDALQYFDTIHLPYTTDEENYVPEILYNFYRYIIVFNHYKNELHIIENVVNNEPSTIESIESIIFNKNFGTYSFKVSGEESSNFSDAEFIEIIKKGKQDCISGDIIQIVLSRQFSQHFIGDEFNVYRTLRSINPSPYLFFFDFGKFKIFGSSPESQIVVRNKVATINPIAGTFRRTGDDILDAELAKKLAEDPKEVAEHVMLVDLARNDLSKHGENVKVERHKEIQFFSHVIHMVSKVSAEVSQELNPFQLIADTFPAGTLSGAPKYKALELINTYEQRGRGFYGGSIGYIDLHGNINQAITIRSFLSKNNCLYYQAGAGIVAVSKEENELQEINNKLAALKAAIKKAETL